MSEKENHNIGQNVPVNHNSSVPINHNSSVPVNNNGHVPVYDNHSQNAPVNDNIVQNVPAFVTNALKEKNFEQLSQNISTSVQAVFKQLNIQPTNYPYTKPKTVTVDTSPCVRGEPGKAGAVAGMIFGILGTSVFGILALVFSLLGLAFGAGWMFAAVWMLPFLALNISLIAVSKSVLDRNKHFVRFRQIIGERNVVKISEFSSATGIPEQKVTYLLTKMMNKGYFRKPHMDVNKTCLMLDDQAYEQYCQTQQNYQNRLEEQERAEEAHRNIFSTVDSNDPVYIKTMEEGKNYLEQIRHANENIKGELISSKLDKLERLVEKIFAILKQKPDQLPKLRSFMNYYMPTTWKLVSTYQELDAQPVAGQNIQRSKEEIEKSLDTVNYAYEKLLDSFYEEDVIDISSDITVLETMFSQAGLTKNQFEKKGEQT